MREIYSYRAPRRKRSLKKFFIIVLLIGLGFAAYKFFVPTPVERAVNKLQFDASVSEILQPY